MVGVKGSSPCFCILLPSCLHGLCEVYLFKLCVASDGPFVEKAEARWEKTGGFAGVVKCHSDVTMADTAAYSHALCIPGKEKKKEMEK